MSHTFAASSAEIHAPSAVYIHVPFCLHHCGYCDFTLVANRDHLIPNYLEQLSKEFAYHCRDFVGPRTVDTMFLGGGTPTHLSPAHLQQLMELIHHWFRLAPGGEFSIEANPDGLCDERLTLLRENGVNRLSLGVQSFDDDVLKTLERQHSAAEALETVRRASDIVANVSLDLIFGVPGQSAESWRQTLSVVTTLPVRHVSTYGLTYEQGTPFFRRERSGGLRRLPDELEREMYLDGIDVLTGQGFQHYEVSNFARPGFECRHNQVYWNADEYFAFGPGAARYINGIRTTNCRSVVRWLNSWKSGSPCVEESEQLIHEDKARESIMLALRMIRGLHVPSFEARFLLSLEELAADAVKKHISTGLLERQGDYLRLTQDGLLIADSVVTDFL
jgi:oxygen-independent coproporphyrinogen-3 oxidase